MLWSSGLLQHTCNWEGKDALVNPYQKMGAMIGTFLGNARIRNLVLYQE